MLEFFKLLVELIQVVIWPATIMLVLWYLKEDIANIFERVAGVTIKVKGIEVTLDRLVESKEISTIQRKELSGLTANEIWFLTDVAERKPYRISEMKPSQKVMTKTLLDMELLAMEKYDESKVIVLTKLGEKLLEIAKNILD